MKHTLKLEYGTDIVIDVENVGIRPATTREMKYGYKPDIYILYRKDQYTPIFCRNSEAAWTHYNAAVKAGKCKYFGIELDGKQFVYEDGRFVFDAVINPDVPKYRVEYNIDGENGFVYRASFAAAKDKADDEFGCVRSLDGQFIYGRKEPDVYHEFWDAL